MPLDRIDFISAYCDRWCERCAFTERCSTYLIEIAEGMCGDFSEAVELVVGSPRSIDGEAEPAVPDWLADFDNSDPSEEELAEITRREEESRARVRRSRLRTMSDRYWALANRWLTAQEVDAASQRDPIVAEALAVLRHDAAFVGVKLTRALQGRERALHDRDDDDEDPVQSDWNGSAKVALLSIDRSTHAWRVIAQSTGEREPERLADALANLGRAVRREFPKCEQFIRPGFDELWR